MDDPDGPLLRLAPTRGRLLRGVAVAAVVGGALFGLSRTVGTGRGSGTIGDRVEIDPDDPIAGVAVASIEEAQARVGFTISEPRGLGLPVEVMISDDLPRASRGIALLFDTERYGRVFVLEHPPEVPTDDYERSIRGLVESADGDRSVHGTLEVVRIRGGTRALLSVSGDGASAMLFWLENPDVEFVVGGPLVDERAVREIAERI
jgi:hypothetical protein